MSLSLVMSALPLPSHSELIVVALLSTAMVEAMFTSVVSRLSGQ